MLQGNIGPGEFNGWKDNIQLGNQETDFYKGRINIAMCSFGYMTEHELRADDAEIKGMEAYLCLLGCKGQGVGEVKDYKF